MSLVLGKKGQKKQSQDANKAQWFKRDKVRGGLQGLAGQKEEEDAGDEKQIVVFCFARQGARESPRTRRGNGELLLGSTGREMYENRCWSLEGRFRTSWEES